MADGPGAEGSRSRKGRRRRLSRSAEFERVYREGRSHASRHLVLHSFPRAGDADDPRLGHLGRPQGGRRGRAQPDEAAAARGVLVRRGRTVPAGHDFVLVARPDAAELAERGEPAVEEALRELLGEAGLLGEDAGRMSARAVARAARSGSTGGSSRRRSPRRCKYHPSCSAYALQAIRTYGILRGVVLAGWRLLRCNPWSHGGFDPVEQQRLFRPRAAPHS